MKLSEINIYPVKGLRRIRLAASVVEKRGLRHDRRLMLTDRSGMFITQREMPKLATVRVAVEDERLRFSADGADEMTVVPGNADGKLDVRIWDSICEARAFGSEVNDWFSELLGTECVLVEMPETTERHVSERVDRGDDIVSFADGYPLLVANEASLNELNRRIGARETEMDDKPLLTLGVLEKDGLADEGVGGPKRADEGDGGPKRADEGVGGPKRADEGVGGPKRADEGVRGPKRADEGVRGPKRADEGVGGPKRAEEGVGGPKRADEGVGGPKRADEGVRGPLPMERFRPNVVVSGAKAFAEDAWAEIRIGDARFRVVKPCARCVVTTVDQERGEVAGKEPLKTLATFRKASDVMPEGYESFGLNANSVLFGENLIPVNPGATIRVGDEVEVLSYR